MQINRIGIKAMLLRVRVLLIIVFVISSCNKKTLFRSVSPDHSGIHFSNRINQSDSINVLDFENVYNGGGVGIGDFNGDGLQDIYFAGNLVSNKLYLNKGGFQFDDITEKAGVAANGRWCRGITIVDINNDGLSDIYVSASVKKDPKARSNLLYINQGIGADSIPTFREMAEAYNLDDTTHSTMSSFFDYDNDGDLDVYITVNQIIRSDFPNKFRSRNIDGSHPSTGRLYHNDWDSVMNHPVFTDVSREAGITIEGYGHSSTITDINKDGWKDIYVSNDYLSQNILYINNRNGTFTDKVTTYFKHTSANAMGNDVADINNDGLQDIIELDMNPEDNFRKKMMLNANSYQTYQNSDHFGLQYQYVRNTVQLNQGPHVLTKDSIGDPVFSDIGFFSGLAETDWSWTPLVVDFDNDGFRDVIITNGFPKDVTDHDFRTFRNDAYLVASKKQLLDQIPEVKIHNYGYRNNGNATFQNVTEEWGLTLPTFSSGAAYADLDNDGDLDLVINNINDSALVYENTLHSKKNIKQHFLSVRLNGDSLNRNGMGAWIELYYAGKQQVYEHFPYRGYLSTHQRDAHFGLGTINMIDSLIVIWPDNRKQILKKIQVNQLLQLWAVNANDKHNWNASMLLQPIFSEITDSVKAGYTHQQIDFIDFNIQKLLPHKFTESGPALAAGDLDGNGLDDFIMGGSFSNSALIFLQQQNGEFLKRELLQGADNASKRWEDMGIELFDADGDSDLDAYITSGGFQHQPNSPFYQDKLYINDGKANFKLDSIAIPVNYSSKSCVRAADFDKDGDLDLFIGGRVSPWNYPAPVSSFIYRNDSKDGTISFVDISALVAPALDSMGLVTDAVWTDFNNDGWLDLVITGEWMPLTFLLNKQGTFEDITQHTGTKSDYGWWRSIVPGDFDNDGDIDYVAGNLGLNSYYRASFKEPVKIYAKDFNNDGSYDAIPTLFLQSTLGDSEKKEYPAQTRDDLIKQMIAFRSKFRNYKSFATASFDQLFTPAELKDALVLKATNFSHCLFRNNGNNKFEVIPLPSETQYSCLNGMIAEDFNQDGNLDLMITGNDYGTEVSVGRYDACNGMLLKGDGKGNFSPAAMLESGIYIPGNARALIQLRNNMGKYLIVASQNKGPLKLYVSDRAGKIINFNNDDEVVEMKLRNGKIRRHEINFGASYLSQSARFIQISPHVLSMEVINVKGNRRTIQF